MTGEKKIADAFLTNFLTRSMMSVRLVLVSCSCIPLNSSKEPLSTPGGGLRVMHRKSLTRVRHGVSPGPLKTGSRASGMRATCNELMTQEKIALTSARREVMSMT